MQNNDFFIEKQRAVERMKEMQNRSRAAAENGMPPTPFFVSAAGSRSPEKKDARHPSEKKDTRYPSENPLSGVLKLPFLSSGDPDISLILGLFLLLSSESGDRLLLYALLYILL